MSKVARTSLGALALLGLGVSIYLTLFHFRILTDPAFESACKFNSTLDCDKVNTSAFAKVWGIPLGLYGAAFYLVILALTAFSASAQEKFSRAVDLIFGLSTLAVLLSVGLAYISASYIGAWCVFCISLYVINLLLLVVSAKAAPGSLKDVITRLNTELAGFYRSPLIYTSVLLFAGVVLLGGGVYKQQVRAAQDLAVTKFVQDQIKEQKPAAPAAEAPKSDSSSSSTASPSAATAKTDTASQPAPVQVPEGELQEETVELARLGFEPVRGKADAPVTLVIFSDFQCPYCQRAAFVLDDVAVRFPGQVGVIYKQYPLDSECNPYLNRPMHEYACEASMASKCAHKQGKFWEMHDLMFKNQQSLDPDSLKQFARDIGLNVTAFNACMQNDRDIILEVAKDIEQGRSIPISGTPSIFINGRKWKGPVDPEVLAKVVEQVLNSTASR